MKTNTLIFTLILLFFSLQGVVATESGTIRWYTNYREAAALAKTSSKPMLLLFTGTDWCTWCKKLDEEVFSKKEFSDLSGDTFIFVELDFPMNGSQDAEEKRQNRELQNKYNIQGYPSVVIISSDEKKIGVTGYRPGGATAYANHLKKLMEDYSAYQQKIN